MRPFVVLLISGHSLSHLFREGFVVHPRISLTVFLPSSSNGWPGPFGPLHWWQPRHLQPLTGDTPRVYWNTLWVNPNKWVSLSLLPFLSYRCFFLSGGQRFTWSWSRASCLRRKSLSASFLSHDCWCWVLSWLPLSQCSWVTKSLQSPFPRRIPQQRSAGCLITPPSTPPVQDQTIEKKWMGGRE